MNKKLLALIAMMLAAASSAAIGKADIEYVTGSFSLYNYNFSAKFLYPYFQFKPRTQPLLHSTKNFWTSNMKMKIRHLHLKMAYDVIHVYVVD